MISRVFHAWERRLASVSKDRVVRPFDWGVDWIPDNLAGPTGPALHGWVDGIMRDTPAFFDTPPTTDYDFDARTGELRFPSALTTPHSENNTVLARWFPSEEKKRAVVVLPQWN